MPYIGNPIYQSAFVTDTFSGNGSTTAFTMSVAPAGTTNVLVAISGVLQDPATYGVVGTTITFSGAPPSGTGNISCRYLGVPVTGVTTTAYRTVTEFTATAGQTTFTPPSYTVGFINVYRNGVLLGSADYTATNGTTVVLATGATSGDLVTVESFLVSSVLNAIQNTAGAVSTSNLAGGSVTAAKMGSGASWAPSGTVVQVVTAADAGSTTSSATRVNLNAATIYITPKSTSSKIIISVTFQGIITAGGAGINSYGNFDISEGSTALSASYQLGVVSGSGSNLRTSASCNIVAYVTNSALTTRGFTVYGFKTGGTSSASATAMIWTITEVIA